MQNGGFIERQNILIQKEADADESTYSFLSILQKIKEINIDDEQSRNETLANWKDFFKQNNIDQSEIADEYIEFFNCVILSESITLPTLQYMTALFCILIQSISQSIEVSFITNITPLILRLLSIDDNVILQYTMIILEKLAQNTECADFITENFL